MSSFDSDARLAALLAKKVVNSKSTHVVLLPSEAEAQRVEVILRSLSQGTLFANDILYFPGFLQAGVFRFESARAVIAKRLSGLQHLTLQLPSLVVTTPQGLCRAVPSLQWMEQQRFPLAVGQECDMEVLLERLEQLGYQTTQKVEDMGEVCVRGSIVDLWTPGERSPTRIEFFGDQIDKLRRFRVADQRSYETCDSLVLLPCREFVWPRGENLEVAIENLNDALLRGQVGGAARMDLLENLKHSVPFAGIDDVCLCFSESEFKPFFEVLREKVQGEGAALEVVTLNEGPHLLRACEDIKKLYTEAANTALGKSYLSLEVQNVFPFLDPLISALRGQGEQTLLPLKEIAAEGYAVASLPTKEQSRKFFERANWLKGVLAENRFRHVLLLCRNLDAAIEISALLSKYFPDVQGTSLGELPRFTARSLLATSVEGLPLGGAFFAAGADVDHGFAIESSETLALGLSWLQGLAKEESLETFTEEESASASRAASETLLAAQFSDYIEGELVVHVQHGVSVYRGLVTIPVGELKYDFLALEFANHDKVYVPVHKMALVQRYMGASAADQSALDSLRGTSWEKRKAKAKVDAEKMARELMEHRAKHAAAPGHPFTKIGEEYLEFEAAFPYDETTDQVKAIREIMSDMTQAKAMDRILCGDVGFGKTEVAMRAAYRAVLDGKQVAWLVPTTILAHQHYRNLVERFKGFAVRIESLDRLATTKIAKARIEALANGEIDIVIGTHRLLSGDVRFRDLGLLIVDEEHRFGVLQKEKIKTLSYGIDELAMTATPIPRTLQMAMLGLRDLSLLTTPPKSRLAVKTFVCPFDENIVRDAIQAELARGGQVFYVHNRVEELASVQHFLKGLLPQVRLAVGHGKMQQKELEKTMIDFIEGAYDVLLCTTIIESGIDMPNVNTILVQNADHFGLSQLYQLRGRVGRRSTRGYAYFLSSGSANREDDGMRRLNVIKEHQELGSGFVIASNDLELRGAGNILGDEQSGQINDVGLETYLQMLDDAIKALGGVKVTANPDVEIQVPLQAQIPESYIENARERLKIYRRFFGARSEEALQSLLSECEDRFGPFPESVADLAEFARIRRWLMKLGALSINVTEDVTEVRLSREVIQPAEHDENAERLIKRILDACNRHAKGMRITPDGRVLLSLRKKMFASNKASALAELKRLLSLLAGETNAESSKL